MELPAAALDGASKRSLSRYHSGLNEKHTIAQKSPPLPTITKVGKEKKKEKKNLLTFGTVLGYI